MNEITAVLIAKNEQKVIERCLRSVKGMPVVVLDTGSTDQTVAMSERAGAKVVSVPPSSPFHFAEARNLALTHVETPWAFSIDADEVLRGGGLGKLYAAARDPKGASAFTVSFINQDPTNPKRTFLIHKLKLFRKDTWAWRYRVHEQLFNTVDNAQMAALDDVSVEHLPSPNKKARHSQNVDLLKICIKENPEYTRAFRHLGQELMLNAAWEDAIPYLYHYAEKTDEGAAQRSHAMTLIGMCLINKGGHYEDALQWLDRAAAADTTRREPLFWAGRYVATLAKSQPEVERAMSYYEKALAIKNDGTSLGTTDFPEAWDDGLIKRQVAACKRGLVQLQGR